MNKIIMKEFTTQEVKVLFNRVIIGDISFPEMVEIMNERVSESEVRKYKDGDFVYEDGRIMIVKSYPNIYHVNVRPSYSDMLCYNGEYGVDFSEPSFRYATTKEKQELIELLRKDGKRWNAEKLCVEDIPQPKFKKGDKVRIKEGISSKTHIGEFPCFSSEMDNLIGKTMTVDRYTDGNYYLGCEGIKWIFAEDWLEPYVEELKKGDLAIFWDEDKKYATIRIYEHLNCGEDFMHRDHSGFNWKNAIKFESIEQFEKLLKGEI